MSNTKFGDLVETLRIEERSFYSLIAPTFDYSVTGEPIPVGREHDE